MLLNNNYLMITFLKKHGGVNLKIKEKVKNKNKFILYNIGYERKRETMYYETTFTGRIILIVITEHTSARPGCFIKHRNQSCLTADF